MRLVHRKKGLPLWFVDKRGRNKIVLESNLRIGSSRLRAKLVILESEEALREFWEKEQISGSDLGPRCPGAVNGLCHEAIDFNEKGSESNRRLEADPRFFCIIGLVRGFLNAEVITHEAAHAGFAFMWRARRTPWDVHVKRLEEEAVCYPAGEIAGKIAKIYHENKELLKPPEKKGKKGERADAKRKHTNR